MRRLAEQAYDCGVMTVPRELCGDPRPNKATAMFQEALFEEAPCIRYFLQ